MLRRSAWVFVLCCCILALFVVQGFAQQDATPQEQVLPDAVQQETVQDEQSSDQQAVTLQYKFTPGERLRYKMVMDMAIDMQGMPEAGQMPAMNIKMIMLMRQGVKKVLPDGDAEVAMTIESMKMDMMGNCQEIPVDKIPAMTMIMSPQGVIKSVQGLENVPGMSGMQFMNMGGMNQLSVALPANPVKIGDTWNQEIPFPMGGGNLKVQSALLSTDEPLGKHKVAKFSQNIDGDISMQMPMPAGASGGGSGMSMNSKILMNGTVSFSTDKGYMVRTDGKGTMQMIMAIPGAAGQQGGNMNMNMQMNYEVFLVPNTPEKAPAKPAGKAKAK